MRKLKILVACEESQAVCIAFRELGHEAYSCDTEPCSGGHPEWHLRQDVIPVLKEKWDMIIAFPPCTHLCSSGARWFAKKRANGQQQQGIDFFMLFTNLDCPKVCIENPVGIMSRIYRKPDQIIQPFEFSHPETKKTCLWLKGLHCLQPTNEVEPDFMRNSDGSFKLDKKGKKYSRIHWQSGRKDPKERSKIRSKTYHGIAEAMAIQWGGECKH